ncbi:MAG: hypothetical protein U0K19_00125 [Bifidobacteriaceae bacterium]|nr:hypothetical protein [Bifidobacteriaceae bacterium]
MSVSASRAALAEKTAPVEISEEADHDIDIAAGRGLLLFLMRR